MGSEKKFGIFISSTKRDLEIERRELVQSIYESGNIALGMESFFSGNSSIEMIKKAIDDCDIYLLLVGQKYGSLYEKGGNISYVEWEYNYAKQKNKERCIMVLSKKYSEKKIIDGFSVDDIYDVDRTLINKFRDKVQNENNRSLINSIEDLSNKLNHKLTDQTLGGKLVGWVRGDSVMKPLNPKKVARDNYFYSTFDMSKIYFPPHEQQKRAKIEKEYLKILISNDFPQDYSDYVKALVYAIDEKYLPSIIKLYINNINSDNYNLISEFIYHSMDGKYVKLIMSTISNVLQQTDDLFVKVCLVEGCAQNWEDVSVIGRIRTEEFLFERFKNLGFFYETSTESKAAVLLEEDEAVLSAFHSIYRSISNRKSIIIINEAVEIYLSDPCIAVFLIEHYSNLFFDCEMTIYSHHVPIFLKYLDENNLPMIESMMKIHNKSPNFYRFGILETRLKEFFNRD